MARRSSFLILPALLSALMILVAPDAQAQSVNARNMLKIARSHASQGEWEQAKEYADRAIEAEAGYIDAIYMRAFAYRELEEYEKAEKDFREVIRRNPDYLPTYGGLAEVFIRQEQYDKAEELFVELSAQPHGALWASYYRGVVAYLQGDLDKAAESWTAALGRDKNFAPALHNLGALHLARGEAREALVKFREALASEPETPIYRLHIAWALERIGQPELALNAVVELVNDGPNDQKVWLLARGLQSLLQNQAESAVNVLETVTESNPDTLDGWILLGRAHIALKQYDKAREALETAKELDGAFGEIDELLKMLPKVEEPSSDTEAPLPDAEPVSPSPE